MLDRLTETISRYRMFARGHRVGVAVSGGADSVCLLHVLCQLAPRWELQLAVLHLDHQMRGEESLQDAQFVRELAAGLGLEAHFHSVDVRRVSRETGDNLEQTARRLRREFFLGFIRDGRLDRVALGHTRSDQAETVLFRLLRGAGAAGLAGIRPVTPEGLVRPLIETDRAAVLAYLRQRGLPWREDSSNLDRAFARNRIRHDLLPALARQWNPALADTLAQTAALAQDEEDYWAAEVARVAATELHARPPAVLLQASRLRQLPPALARRLARAAIGQARGDLRGIGFSHAEQVLGLAARAAGHGRLQVPGLEVVRSFDWIRLSPPGDTPPDYRFPLTAPGEYAVPGTGLRLRLQLIGEAVPGYNEGGSALDWGRVSAGLELRNWRPGDRYRPAGHAHPLKIKLLFHRARAPLWERRQWPLMISGDRIVWAARFGPEAEAAATAASRRLLKVEEIGFLL